MLAGFAAKGAAAAPDDRAVAADAAPQSSVGDDSDGGSDGSLVAAGLECAAFLDPILECQIAIAQGVAPEIAFEKLRQDTLVQSADGDGGGRGGGQSTGVGEEGEEGEEEDGKHAAREGGTDAESAIRSYLAYQTNGGTLAAVNVEPPHCGEGAESDAAAECIPSCSLPASLPPKEPQKHGNGGWPTTRINVADNTTLGAILASDRCDLDRRKLTPQQFWDEYASKSRPVILQGLMEDWVSHPARLDGGLREQHHR